MRKIFRFLVVAGVLMVLFATGISAAEVGCPGHGSGTGIAASQELNISGVYYLTGNITGRTQRNDYYEAFNVTANDVTLCLNGFNITPNQAAVAVRVDGGVTGFKLCNCQPGGGVITGKGDNRSLLLMKNTEVSMYKNVHIDDATEITKSVAVQANAGASFTMYGGTINNNVFASDGANTSGNTAALLGGDGSKIRLLGGEIKGNRITATANGSYVAAVVTNAGTVEIDEGFTISDNVINAKTYGAGGVLGFDADKSKQSPNIAEITMTGGTIANNTCNRSGGVAMYDATTFNMIDGEITGNKGNQYGGGLCVSHGTVTMSDGEISGNTLTNAKPYGAQVAVGSNYAGDTIVFTMTGGTIAAAQGVETNDLTVCHGTANIQGGTVTGKVDTVGMITEAVLNISGGTILGKMANGELERSSGVAADSAITITGGKFSAADNDWDKLTEEWLAAGATLSQDPVEEGGTLFYKTDDPTPQAVCDKSHSGWNPFVGGEIDSPGQYCLEGNVNCAVTVTADNVTLCLNGNSITPSDSVAIHCSGKNLKIVNCSASNGTITGKATCSVQVVEGGSVTIGDNVHINGASVVPVMVGLNAAFYMRGGEISNNTFSSEDAAVAPVVLGENGSFTMSGGTISGNTVTGTASGYVGGAVAAAGRATVDLRRGTISGNVVTHTVSDGDGYAGGAVVLNGGTLKIRSGVTINGNKATSNKISAGAVCANAGTTVTMTGGTISGNTAEKSNKGNNNGGGVALYGTGTTFTMSGGTISHNSANTGGGVEIADSSAVFTMTGGTITENNAGRWGGGVCIRKGTFNLSGGTIEDNDLSSAYEYGNQVTVGLYSRDCSGTFNMTGGAIVDTAVDTTDGAETSTDVTVSQGTANVSGGTITGQVATLGIVTPAALTISGGTITGDVTNAVILPTDNDNYPTQDDAETGLRKDCTITITDGEIIGTLSSTSHDNRKAGTKYVISGGKFSGETDRGDLVLFLDQAQELLSVQDIDEGQLVYEVGVGLAYTGAYMEFGSSLDFGLCLNADLGDYSTDIADYTCLLTGGDEDVTYDLKVENGNLLFMAHGIAAKEMRDDLTFTLMKDGDVWFTRTMSVYDAACEFRADELKAAHEEGRAANSDYITMLADMVYYGTQAQKRFNYNTRALLDKPDLEEISEAESEAWPSSGVTVDGGQGSKVSTSLSLKDQIELNFYISDPKATVSEVTFAGKGITTEEYTVTNATGTNNAQTLISFREIPVTLVKEVAAFTVELADDTTFEVRGSIADHVNMAQDSNTEGKLINALQKYVDSVCEVLS